MPDRRLRTAVLAASIALCAGAVMGAGQPGAEGTLAGEYANEIDGRALFNAHCASCHGTSGTGNGPAAASLRRRPPDITGLTLANGGMFPTERLRRIVDGRDIEAHGDRDMPVWGDAFKAMRGDRSEEAVRERIAAILRYLASMQRRQA